MISHGQVATLAKKSSIGVLSPRLTEPNSSLVLIELFVSMYSGCCTSTSSSSR